MFNIVRHFLRTPNNFGIQIYSKYSVQTPVSSSKLNKKCGILYGQPVPQTHPHILKYGEVTPGIQKDEYIQRRENLMNKIMKAGNALVSNKAHIVVIPSSSKVYMSDHIPYVFRQSTDFLYFTGCQEPDSILVLTARNDSYLSTLFVRQKDPHAELWDGPRTGVEAASNLFGVDHSLPVTEFEKYFISFISEHKNNLIWYDNTNIVNQGIHDKLCQLLKANSDQNFTSPKNVFHEIRVIKSQSEIKLMHESCKIASAAIKNTIENSKPGINEHQLFAMVDYECRMNGAEFLAYPPVVAGGNNANVIHYISNNQIVQNGDMVLLDAGCEYHGYASDITRTWPINGTFSEQQRILYEVLLDVQKELIKSLSALPSLDHLYHEMLSLLAKRLQEINLLPNNLSKSKLMSAAYSYCPHHVSHYLGMDVHDTDKVPRSINVKPGMIVTVEPGIYINPKNEYAPSEFYGLGLRIEDDILITQNGPIVLTAECPKEIENIEYHSSKNQS